ncbi:unnamed protein product (macronuclear) [Paramecium tetraurelia]|uniref:Complex 1 LYR protein domain-containing protein n=1 Tax=Paramecium tetraurelia TaxID=5888 RepID=A0D672_PARTE|nr:uncharacterized protein GSPATT00013969001 [Paramecium tetraurelia]CAK78539.1 unnamed protein product [Paramecium tetraurelia]|eukprot:XP_001445936.1 hypothetical protein (macronuclear) [Paramecium tetraurelia strain d4-2]
MSRVHSKFQKEILQFYRSVLKWASLKPEPAKSSIIQYAQNEYRKNQNIPKKKFDRIEFLFRQGKNKFEIWKDAKIDSISIK